MKVLLAGGGTGGHVYPAIAMGDALRARGHELAYAGDPRRLEGRVAPRRGYEFHAVRAPRYPRAGAWGKLLFAASLLAATWRSRRMLRSLRPDLVLGVGGYIMAPTVLAAFTLRIPSALHESNVAPGLANRLCARVASLVLLTYEETGRRLRCRAEKLAVGCPVDPEVLRGDRQAACRRYGLDPERRILLVVGGSLGAAALNELGMAAARRDRSWQLLWITGPRYHAGVLERLGAPPPGTAVIPYEDHMADAWAASDLVLARAGSSTLAELTAVGRPAVLVPSPNVTDNHQEANARGLERVGAAIVALERDLDPGAVLDRVAELMADPASLARMAAASRAQGRAGVAERVAEELERRFG